MRTEGCHWQVRKLGETFLCGCYLIALPFGVAPLSMDPVSDPNLDLSHIRPVSVPSPQKGLIDGLVASNAILAKGRDDDLHRFIQEDGEDFAARNLFLKDGGPGSLVMVAGAGILEVSENRRNAERFLRFMLSTVAQQYFAGTTFEYPLVEGVNTHRLLPSISELNGPDIDAAQLADVTGTRALLRDLGIIP